ncbi:MAG TPA: ABC transporter permease [Spirochaetota bacterium]|nr:ABC transporter permease [Spirochaetota bacterium]HPS86354.1 ABC transporter permease [Spirochaetota bacterium]
MLRMSSRTDCSRNEAILIRTSAIILALAAVAFFIMLLGHNPFSVYISMIEGAFGSGYRITETIRKAIPLIISSLGISLAFRLKFWNIGAEGQIMMGAFGATFCALNFQSLPSYVLLPLMGLASIICGGIWGAIPAYFRAKFRTNETIFTLMMNYIALKWITYLQYGPWKDPGALGFPKIPGFTENAVLPAFFGLHIGWIIALILVVVLHLFVNHTKRGYEINVVGESENTGRYAGMNVKFIIIYTIFLSGGLCGLAGMIEASGVNKTLSVEITRGVGYTAIITSWLSSLRAPVIAVVCILFAAMIQGGTFIQMAFQIPQSAAQILQGMILFFVLGSEFFIRYRISIIKDNKMEAEQ